MYKVSGVFLVSVCCGVSAKATQLMPSAENYLDVRALGMGGVSIPIANDDGAVFANPGGVGQQDDSKTILRSANFPNISLGADILSQKILDNYMKAKNEDSVKELENVMAAKSAKVFYTRGSIFPTFTIMRLQFGLLADVLVEGERKLPGSSFAGADAVIEARERSQTSAVVGFSVPHQKSGFSAGMTARYVWRTSTKQNVPVYGNAIKRTSSIATHINHTKGLGVDGGMLFRPEKKILPTIGLSLQDIGNSSFAGVKSRNEKEIEKANFGAGISWNLSPKKAFMGVVFGVEGKHINDDRLSAKNKMHFGSEIFWGNTYSNSPFAMRVGHNMSGLSYGAMIDLIFLKLDFASYVEPISGVSGISADRRNFVRLSVDLRA